MLLDEILKNVAASVAAASSVSEKEVDLPSSGILSSTARRKNSESFISDDDSDAFLDPVSDHKSLKVSRVTNKEFSVDDESSKFLNMVKRCSVSLVPVKHHERFLKPLNNSSNFQSHFKHSSGTLKMLNKSSNDLSAKNSVVNNSTKSSTTEEEDPLKIFDSNVNKVSNNTSSDESEKNSTKEDSYSSINSRKETTISDTFKNSKNLSKSENLSESENFSEFENSSDYLKNSSNSQELEQNSMESSKGIEESLDDQEIKLSSEIEVFTELVIDSEIAASNEMTVDSEIELDTELEIDSGIEVGTELEIDSEVELSDIEAHSEPNPIDEEIVNPLLNNNSELELSDDTLNPEPPVNSDLETSSDFNSNLEINSDEIEVNTEVEIASIHEVGEDVSFLFCENNEMQNDTEELSNNEGNLTIVEEPVLDMPILTLEPFDDNEEAISTETHNSNFLSKYSSENDKSRETSHSSSHLNRRPSTHMENSNAMSPIRFEEETSFQSQEPVEVSFFTLDEENLEITSEQALNMFENNPTDSRLCYQGEYINSSSQSNNIENKINSSRSTSHFHRNSHDMPDIHELMNIGNNDIHDISVTEGNVTNDGIHQYDYMDLLPFSNTEEVVSYESCEATYTVPTASTEVEILTTDSSGPMYTDLTPASPKHVIETSSAVSEALQTLVGNMDFDSASGIMNSNSGGLPCSNTVETTLDANGEFVVQVMGSGINMSIPNHYYNQINENTDPNYLLDTISEMDIMDILNNDYNKNGNSSNYPSNEPEGGIESNASPQESYYPSSPSDCESNSPGEEILPQKEVSTKRKKSVTDGKDTSSKESSPKKKCHSSVLAALRESIFRSKARKIVNQLGRDTELMEEDLPNEDAPVNSGLDQNQNYREKGSMESLDNPENYGHHSGSSRSKDPFPPPDDSPPSYDSDYKEHRSHRYHRSRESRGRSSYNCCGSPSPGHYSSPVDEARHHYRKPQHRYERAFKPYRKDYYSKSRCQNKCCAEPSPSSSSSRGNYRMRRNSDSPPPLSRKMRPSYSPSPPSCCSKCNHGNNSTSTDNMPSVMMLRPDELTSMIKKAEGKEGPVVVMPSETMNNTDGDPLKVQLVYLVYPMDGKNGQRMSTDTLRHSFQKNPRDLAKSPSCGVSCSSSFQDPYSPSHPHPSNFNSLQGAPSSYRNKEGSWNDIEGPRHHSHPHSIPHHKPLPRAPPPQPQHRYPESVQYTDQEKIGQPEDSKDYLRKPIEAWSYADVIYFLMDACKEIRIDPNEVQFKSSDNGSALLRMSPSDFDILSANNGQKLYDYFIKFKTQHYLISECQSARPSYNYGGPYPPPLQEPYSPCNDHPNGQASGYQDHYHQYPDYHHHQGSPYGSPGYHHPPDSPSQEYVPQGAQYSSHHDHHAFHSPDDHHGRYHEIPSAAGKTFAPLHNYDDPTSDPDESDDEKPPEPPKKRGPGRPPKPENERKRKAKKTGRLWEFIRNLLLDPKTCPSLVRWEDPTEGVFRIVQSDVIANKWGMRKNNEKMNYEKLSRAMRYYYKAKIFEPVLGKRLVYKFGANAKGWRPLHADNPNFQNGV